MSLPICPPMSATTMDTHLHRYRETIYWFDITIDNQYWQMNILTLESHLNSRLCHKVVSIGQSSQTSYIIIMLEQLNGQITYLHTYALTSSLYCFSSYSNGLESNATNFENVLCYLVPSCIVILRAEMVLLKSAYICTSLISIKLKTLIYLYNMHR